MLLRHEGADSCRSMNDNVGAAARYRLLATVDFQVARLTQVGVTAT